MSSRRPAPLANPAEKTDPVAEATDRLSMKVRCLREVLDDLWEDFSWVTRNGLPIQPMEHVRVRRMARDPNADDWAARLVVDRFKLPENVHALPLGSDSPDALTRNLTAAFEAAAKGQLGPVLQAVDGVQRISKTCTRSFGVILTRSDSAGISTVVPIPADTDPLDVRTSARPSRNMRMRNCSDMTISNGSTAR